MLRTGLALLALMLGGCIPTSVCPLSDPAKAQIDERLLGRWKSDDDEVWQTPAENLKVIRKPTRKDLPPGVLELVVPDNQGEEQYFVFATRIEETSYLNWFPLKKTESWEQANPSYCLIKYHVDKDRLRFWSLQTAACADAVAQGKIQGKVQPGTRSRFVAFTDSQENLVRFLVQEGRGIWEKEPSSVHTRVK